MIKIYAFIYFIRIIAGERMDYIVNFDKWLKVTAAMPADCRAWYLNIVGVSLRSGGIAANDMDAVAMAAGVRHSEYDRFVQAWHTMLRPLFVKADRGLLFVPAPGCPITIKEEFTEKRRRGGFVSAILKRAGGLKGINATKAPMNKLREILTGSKTPEIQAYNDMSEKQFMYMMQMQCGWVPPEQQKEGPPFYAGWKLEKEFAAWLKYRGKAAYKNDDTRKMAYDKLVKLSGDDPDTAMLIITTSMTNGWTGFFALKRSERLKNGENSQEGPRSRATSLIEQNERLKGFFADE